MSLPSLRLFPVPGQALTIDLMAVTMVDANTLPTIKVLVGPMPLTLTLKTREEARDFAAALLTAWGSLHDTTAPLEAFLALQQSRPGLVLAPGNH